MNHSFRLVVDLQAKRCARGGLPRHSRRDDATVYGAVLVKAISLFFRKAQQATQRLRNVP